MKLIFAFAFLLVLSVLDGISTASPQDRGLRSWREVKCARYRTAWSEALTRFGTGGLGRDFLQRHEAFLASGCLADADVCPRSAEEFKLANIMVILAMNAGAASTFPPFKCPK